MNEFKSALDAAFGPGTVETLEVDQLDGRPVGGHRHEHVLVASTCLCRGDEPARPAVCICLAELPEPVAAIAG